MASTSLVLFCSDDVILLPGHPGWLDTLAEPFRRDPLVGISVPVVTACGYPHQSARTALRPGFYYTSAFAPVMFLARRDAVEDMLRGVTEDIFGDQEPALNLMVHGWKIVMATYVVQYHEGMQTNLRYYGGDDPDAWVKAVRERIRRELPMKYSSRWLARLEQCEMLPCESVYQVNPDGTFVAVMT